MPSRAPPVRDYGPMQTRRTSRSDEAPDFRGSQQSAAIRKWQVYAIRGNVCTPLTTHYSPVSRFLAFIVPWR